jgi:FtsZ-binding cell division protein ZapB
MTDQINLLEEKVSQVLQRLTVLQSENSGVKQENSALKEQLSRLKQEFDKFRVEHNDQADAVKTRLTALLSRIEELEQIGL